jgi:hypothetical protein
MCYVFVNIGQNIIVLTSGYDRKDLKCRMSNMKGLESMGDRIATIIAHAVLNPSKSLYYLCVHQYYNRHLISLPVIIDIDADRYAVAVPGTVTAGASSQKEDNLPKFFDLPKLGTITEPTTIIDRHGRILLWYLPDILTPRVVRRLSRLIVIVFVIRNTGRYVNGHRSIG